MKTYRDWLIGTAENPVWSSAGFPAYSPCDYGLWRSTVGADEKKTDFYEHITLLKDQKPPAPPTTEAPTEPPTAPPTEPPTVPPTEPPTETQTVPPTELPSVSPESTALPSTAPVRTAEEPTSDNTAASSTNAPVVPASSSVKKADGAPTLPELPIPIPGHRDTLPATSSEGSVQPEADRTLGRTVLIIGSLAVLAGCLCFFVIRKKR